MNGGDFSQCGQYRIHCKVPAERGQGGLAYCLQVTLKQRLRALANGLTPRAVLEKFSVVPMVDVHLPTTDGRKLILSRYTEPGKDQQLLLQQLKLQLPPQPLPKICSTHGTQSATAATPV